MVKKEIIFLVKTWLANGLQLCRYGYGYIIDKALCNLPLTHQWLPSALPRDYSTRGQGEQGIELPTL